MYVCIYVCMYVCVYIFTFHVLVVTYMRYGHTDNLLKRTHTYIHTYINIHTYIHQAEEARYQTEMERLTQAAELERLREELHVGTSAVAHPAISTTTTTIHADRPDDSGTSSATNGGVVDRIDTAPAAEAAAGPTSSGTGYLRIEIIPHIHTFMHSTRISQRMIAIAKYIHHRIRRCLALGCLPSSASRNTSALPVPLRTTTS